MKLCNAKLPGSDGIVMCDLEIDHGSDHSGVGPGTSRHRWPRLKPPERAPMTFEKIMHFIAQGVINVSEGLTTIDADSPIHRAMSGLCRVVSDGSLTIADLGGQLVEKPADEWCERCSVLKVDCDGDLHR